MSVDTEAYVVIPHGKLSELMKIISDEVRGMYNDVAKNSGLSDLYMMEGHENYSNITPDFNSIGFSDFAPYHIKYCRCDFYNNGHRYSMFLFCDDTGYDVNRTTDGEVSSPSISMRLGYSNERKTPEVIRRFAIAAKRYFDCQVVFVENDSKGDYELI